MEQTKIEYLKQKWSRLIIDLNLLETTAESYWLEIIQHYSEKHRAYHNLNHLFDLFKQLESHKENIDDLNALSLAIWYHDIFYNPMSKNNEVESANLCSKRLKELQLNPQFIEKVHQLICSTQTHDAKGWSSTAAQKDNEYLLDLDLSILGTDESSYQEYTAQIRKEYRLVPAFLYKPGRKKVLSHFLEKEQIFKTEIFFKRYEAIARDNIRKELESF